MIILIQELQNKLRNEEQLNFELKRTNESLLAALSRVQFENLAPQSVTELVIYTSHTT